MAQSIGHQSDILLQSGTNELEIITLYLQWLDHSTGAISKTAYGINAAKVRELIAMPEKITEVPDSNPNVHGVFLLRDKTIPLVDLCGWFGYEPDLSPEAKAKWVVVVTEINGKYFGFIAHGVDKVYRVSWNDVQPPPTLIAETRSITGVCLVNEQLIQMVDFENITAQIDPTMVLKADIEDLPSLTEEMQEKFVVIADDSRMILSQVQETLESAGYNVIANSDGQEAWDYLESVRELGQVDEKVLAVVSDIEMPRMDGHHLCLLIRSNAAYKKIPVILFSSLINEAQQHKGEAVGADDQITKPELAKLVTRLQECVKKKQEE